MKKNSYVKNKSKSEDRDFLFCLSLRWIFVRVLCSLKMASFKKWEPWREHVRGPQGRYRQPGSHAVFLLTALMTPSIAFPAHNAGRPRLCYTAPFSSSSAQKIPGRYKTRSKRCNSPFHKTTQWGKIEERVGKIVYLLLSHVPGNTLRKYKR